jgi:hypothetical protein
MPGNGELLIVDAVLPFGNEYSPNKLLDIQMLVALSGLERSERQFRNLLSSALAFFREKTRMLFRIDPGPKIILRKVHTRLRAWSLPRVRRLRHRAVGASAQAFAAAWSLFDNGSFSQRASLNRIAFIRSLR